MERHDYACLVFAVARWRHFGEQPNDAALLLRNLDRGHVEVFQGYAWPNGQEVESTGFRILDPMLERITATIPSVGEWAAKANLGDPASDQYFREQVLVYREERDEGGSAGQRLMLVLRGNRNALTDQLRVEYVLDTDLLPGRLDPRKHGDYASR